MNRPHGNRTRLAGVLLAATAALALLVIPSLASSHGRHHDDLGDAGTIQSFDPATGVLVVDLADGGSVSGLVVRGMQKADRVGGWESLYYGEKQPRPALRYEVTGQCPIRGNSEYEIMAAHLAIAPPPPTELNPFLPAPVAAIILKAIQKRPDDRFLEMRGSTGR